MLEFTDKVERAVLEADNKALATYGKHGINVVPISTIRIIDHKIYLMNYLFNKTLDNIKENSKVAITAWSGLEGYQIKAQAEYITEGALFDEATNWIDENIVGRTLVGLLILTPVEVYNVSTSAV